MMQQERIRKSIRSCTLSLDAIYYKHNGKLNQYERAIRDIFCTAQGDNYNNTVRYFYRVLSANEKSAWKKKVYNCAPENIFEIDKIGERGNFVELIPHLYRAG